MFARCYFRVCGGKSKQLCGVFIFAVHMCWCGLWFCRAPHLLFAHCHRVTEHTEYVTADSEERVSWLWLPKRFQVSEPQRLIYAGVSKFVRVHIMKTAHLTSSILFWVNLESQKRDMSFSVMEIKRIFRVFVHVCLSVSLSLSLSL